MVREICDKYDILFIMDEVMAGTGRTGKKMASEYFGAKPQEISATYIHKVVGLGFLINTETSVIEDMMVTLISDLCKEFLRFLIVGHNIERDGIEEIVEKIEKRFFGHSQKALTVAARGVYGRYTQWKEDNKHD